MEHSEIVAAVERAFDAEVAALGSGEKQMFSKADVTVRVLTAQMGCGMGAAQVEPRRRPP